MRDIVQHQVIYELTLAQRMEIEVFSSRMLLSSNRHSRARGNPDLVTVGLAWIPLSRV
jgi:hypothetical protein